LYVAFPHKGDWYLFKHDTLLKKVLKATTVGQTESWQVWGGYSFPGLGKKVKPLLEPFRITKS